MQSNNEKAFLALVRAGLWENEVRLSQFDSIDYDEVYRLAEEQSVIGLVAAGLEHVVDQKPHKKDVLKFIGQTLQLEQRNNAMNYFIGVLVEKMRKAGIYTLLVKGQGVARCYERPLWRSCGDVDFLLSKDNYIKAKSFLLPLASSVETEDVRKLHQAITINPWVVELHGKLPTEISTRVNDVIDDVLDDIFYRGEVRSWDNDEVTVYLPSADKDVIVIFTHFIQHFYVGGVGLRQICDWCRLLYTYNDTINKAKLLSLIKKMGLMSEWKAFASFAVEFLGMPKEAMPFYKNSWKNSRRAKRIWRLILETGNFGHNKDESYRTKYPNLVQKTITFFRRMAEFVRLTTIFPKNAPVFFITYVTRRTQAAL